MNVKPENGLDVSPEITVEIRFPDSTPDVKDTFVEKSTEPPTGSGCDGVGGPTTPPGARGSAFARNGVEARLAQNSAKREKRFIVIMGSGACVKTVYM